MRGVSAEAGSGQSVALRSVRIFEREVSRDFGQQRELKEPLHLQGVGTGPAGGEIVEIAQRGAGDGGEGIAREETLVARHEDVGESQEAGELVVREKSAREVL